MGMTPEIVIAVLACARMGAVHNVIFGGFATDSIRGRIQDCQAKYVITSDIAYRRGNTLQLK
jgi:acetyl-CoA synthetase